MTTAIKALNYTDHGKVKLLTKANHPHVKDQQVIPVIVHEFALAGAEMPIVFVKNTETGEFQPVALMGFKSDENVFCGQKKWRGSYVPAAIMHHPFALMPSRDDETQLQVILMENSHLVNEVEGDDLFDDAGNETEYMQKRKEILGRYYENMHLTRGFVNTLAKLELLSEQVFTIDLDGKKTNLNGLYIVAEKKLNSLSKQDFLALRKKGYLAPIYNHLSSVHQLNNLARLKTQPE
ncbi:MAG: multidrug transporter [Gammaproteobacteria bacterium]|nr:MAG: multidrug transporter [Gammaproteobacteria bacterium]